ncbi:synaptonemal complex central element protein 2-like [Scyliorhinus canicula]|uniref:synaptonemal complex central element protein 2-like n=1 Tax=Scyliorhinus canicula TaxID=7830 RepID=UPI0018F5E016|nr:synaptonemal complex central element protein 2-like [Scyliorhinus canicula]
MMSDKDHDSEQKLASVNESTPKTSGYRKNLYAELDSSNRAESSSLVDEVTASSDFQDSTLDFSSEPPNCFAASDSSVDALCERTKLLVNEINKSRIKDHKLMSNFKDTLILKVSEFSKKIEEGLFEIYSNENKLIEDTLQELLGILDKIRCLESELKLTCSAMATVYKDMCTQPEV